MAEVVWLGCASARYDGRPMTAGPGHPALLDEGRALHEPVQGRLRRRSARHQVCPLQQVSDVSMMVKFGKAMRCSRLVKRTGLSHLVKVKRTGSLTSAAAVRSRAPTGSRSRSLQIAAALSRTFTHKIWRIRRGRTRPRCERGATSMFFSGSNDEPYLYLTQVLQGCFFLAPALPARQ